MKLCNFRVVAVMAATLVSITAFAEAEAGYYSSCEGKTKGELLEALKTVISSHTTINYKTGLPDLYATSDVRPGTSIIWDMYSTASFSVTDDKCGSYPHVGDCWNREHSFPKSWFNDATPMYSDAYHVYPTDGKVNGQRSNYPYGECANGATLPSHNNVDALGKLGTCTFPGYSGTVFEPVDEYKGDFARSYFYMAACYNDRIAKWDSDMLNGTAYPAFAPWAVNLLLKWHRQDPVSQKELDRIEAVAAKQKNRNPFIDHPELAEYIWGNRMGMEWHEGAGSDPMFATPVDGSLIDLGTTGVNIPRSTTITVRGAALEDDVTVIVSGNGFSASAASLSKAAVNSQAGATLTLTFLSADATEAEGSLSLTSGDAATNVSLHAVALDGLPAGPAIQVSDRSFVATWTNIDPSGTVYKLTVKQGGIALDGYPVNVRADAEKDLVEDLMPSTDYTYIVESPTLTSNEVSVRTADPIPSIELIPTTELDVFAATPDEPGEPVIINVESENIAENITIAVKEPFQVSSDKSEWASTLTISPDEEQFFVRLNAAEEGNYTSQLTASTANYEAESLTLEGHVGMKIDFFEDFEPDASGFGNYTNTDPYQGSGCQWRFNNAGIYSKEGCPDEFENPTQAVRFGKNANSSLTMLENLTSGVGTLNFFAHKWNGDSDAEVTVQYSTNDGSTWTDATTFTVSSTSYVEYKLKVDVAGKLRLRFQQTSGQRWLIDNIAADSYASVSPVTIDGEWIAFARGGQIIVEKAPKARLDIYSADGRNVASQKINGSASVALPTGLYIIVINDTARRVVVK